MKHLNLWTLKSTNFQYNFGAKNQKYWLFRFPPNGIFNKSNFLTKSEILPQCAKVFKVLILYNTIWASGSIPVNFKRSAKCWRGGPSFDATITTFYPLSLFPPIFIRCCCCLLTNNWSDNWAWEFFLAKASIARVSNKFLWSCQNCRKFSMG